MQERRGVRSESNLIANMRAKAPAEAETSGGEGIWCAEEGEARAKDRDCESRIQPVNAEFNWTATRGPEANAAGLKEKNVGW